MYLSGSKELDEDVSSNRGVVGDAKLLPRQRTITEAPKITKPDIQSSECLHFFENPDIVESFKDDCSIRKVSTKTLFERERAKGKLRCFLKEKGHTTCSTFKVWKDNHPGEAEELANSCPAMAIYVLLNREVTYKGQKLFVKGAVKSIDPPCTGKPSGLPRHPLTCKNCFSQRQYLVDLSKKRDQAVYDASSENRIGKKHRMKEGSSAPDTQGNNPRKTPTETNLKRKYVHELKTGNANNHLYYTPVFLYNRDNRNWS